MRAAFRLVIRRPELSQGLFEARLGEVVVAVILGDHSQEQAGKGQQPRVVELR
jgi:hypothetical protein